MHTVFLSRHSYQATEAPEKPQQCLPVIVHQEEMAECSRPRACNFPPLAVGCLILKQLEWEEEKAAPPQHRNNCWATGPAGPSIPTVTSPSWWVTVCWDQLLLQLVMEQRHIVNITWPLTCLWSVFASRQLSVEKETVSYGVHTSLPCHPSITVAALRVNIN